MVEAFCEIVLQLMSHWSAGEYTQGGILHLEFLQDEQQEPCWSCCPLCPPALALKCLKPLDTSVRRQGLSDFIGSHIQSIPGTALMQRAVMESHENTPEND